MTVLLGLYDTNPKIVPLQRFLNEKLSLNLTPDGNIGKITQAAISKFQVSQGIVENDEFGACYGPKTEAIVLPFTDAKYLIKSAFVTAAKTLGIETPAIQAVTKVEAKQFGFLPSGRPVILFERHKFYQSLMKKYGKARADSISAKSPDICDDDAGGYLGNDAEYPRFNRAAAIDEECAMLSTSWGLFQIMGFNYAQVGFANVAAYVNSMYLSEANQLMAFVNYIKNDKDQSLRNALINKEWEAFAKEYNGPGYKRNNYHIKLPAEYLIALKQG
jgi:hypothetical protein